MIELNKAYQCEYCGKIFATKGGTHTHESHCRRNERNARACYTCKHYDPERERPYVSEEDKYVVEHIEVEFYNGTQTETVKFSRNICKADGHLLYNPRRMSDWKREWLYNSDNWKPMPTAFEGCPNYEPHDYGYCKGLKPQYPMSHKIIEE